MNGKVYKFDGFLLNTAQRKLFYHDVSISLSAKAFEILLLLIEKQGEVVEKEVFLERVWANSFVEESNLVVHISALRRVLGDKPGERKYIETISGRGYSFISAVEAIENSNKIKSVNSPDSRAGNPQFSSFASPPSIAVLPIQNKDGGTDLNYLANGITQSLIDNLAQIPKLKVLAYSAVVSYENSALDLQEIGFLLGVEKLLLGHISNYKDKLEISVELINAADKSLIWRTQYDGKFDDIFQIRKDISLTIAEKLQLQLTRPEEINLAKQPTTNSAAHKHYLKGKHILDNFSAGKDRQSSLYSALKFFQQAIKLDPEYAAAYAESGRVYFFLFNNGFLNKSDVADKCRTLLGLALNFDANLSEAYVLKGMMEMFFDRNLTAADSSSSYAIKVNPNNAYAYHMRSLTLMFMEKFEEAIYYENQAIQLDPSSNSFNCGLINRFYFNGDFSKAIIQAEETLELYGSSSPAYLLLGLSYAQLKLYDEALKNLQKSLEVNPSPETILTLSAVYALAGNTEKAAEIMNEVLSESTNVRNYYSEIAAVYCALGNIEKTLYYLEQEISDEASVNMFLLKFDPRFRSLHKTPAFNALLRSVRI